MKAAEREKQIKEAEELLGDFRLRVGFAKGLYFGHYLDEKLVPYPRPQVDETTRQMEADLRRFCVEKIDPVKIDREAMISDDVVRGLGEVGVLGACLPKSAGGRELSQASYCKLLEVLGGHCASTALFVNAHHSIGPRALVLFGTKERTDDVERFAGPECQVSHACSPATKPSIGPHGRSSYQHIAVPRVSEP